jgi:hypothetical protein
LFTQVVGNQVYPTNEHCLKQIHAPGSLFFYLGSIHIERHLRSASTSLLSHGLLIPCCPSYEHEGLVSRLDKQYTTSWHDKQYTKGELANHEVMNMNRDCKKDCLQEYNLIECV